MLRWFLRILLAVSSIPGVMVHELGHQIFCWLTGTPVRQVCYFRLGVPPGYVIHDLPRSVLRHMLISAGPLVVSSGLAFGCGWLARQGHGWIHNALTTRIFLTWLGIAIGMHAFPSLEDANSVMSSIWEQPRSWITRLWATPPAALLYLGAFAGWAWLDIVYAVALVWWMPARYLGG